MVDTKMQSKNTSKKKKSVNNGSIFFDHVNILMKRLLDLEYQLCSFEESYPEVSLFIKDYKKIIHKQLEDEGFTSQIIDNLKLIDGVFDFFQNKQINFHFSFATDVWPDLNPSLFDNKLTEFLNSLHQKFLDQMQKELSLESWDQQKKNFIFLETRFADISSKNDLEEVLELYVCAKLKFDSFKKEPNTPELLIKHLSGFNKLRFPLQRNVEHSFVSQHGVLIEDKIDNYLTLNIRYFESPKAIPVVLTNFLIEYCSYKRARHESGNSLTNDVLKEIKEINDIINALDRKYIVGSPFNQHTTHLPHIQGLIQWRWRNKGKRAEVRNLLNSKLESLQDKYPELGVLTSADETLDSQFEKTVSLIAEFKKKWGIP